jgi:hypothetical protein
MPRSKHRRKPGGKAVRHPGRNKPGKPLELASLQDDAAASDPDRAALNRNDLRRLPLLAPLAKDKGR